MIRAQHDNTVMSSFLLFTDNLLCGTGQAYTNWGSPFYRISGNINNYYTYSAPYRPFVADSSVPGAVVMSGIYLNNSFIRTGQSGFVDINYDKGLVYFSNPVTGSLSGNYAVKDFSITLTNKPEENILIETKHSLKPRVGDTVTGLNLNDIVYPIVYLKNNGGTNESFSIGGCEESITKARAIILASSLYERDAVVSILKDTARSFIGQLSPSEMPFNSLGGIKNNVFNYINLVIGKAGANNTIFIKRANVSTFSQENFQSLTSMNPSEVFVAFVDFDLAAYRYPRR